MTPSATQAASALFEIKEVDRQRYDERLRDFLPDDIIDIHTHVWRASDVPAEESSSGEQRAVTWTSLVARDNPVEDLIESYRLLLPGKRVTPLMFAMVPKDNLDVLNAYVAECSRRTKFPALLFTDPAWTSEEVEKQMLAGGFLGAKAYLTTAPSYIPAKEIRIFDFFPHHQLAVYDRHGSIVMLHIPRDGRLRDPLNLAQLLQIERDYPNIRLIVAHVGRAYCQEDVGNAFEILAETERMSFDFCANTNEHVFAQLLGCVGPKRVLFGSDLPILRMRMRRETSAGIYVNVVPKGLYGDVSADKNMREVEPPEADRISFFLYEQLDAFRRASERVGLSRSDLEDVFYHNAKRLLDGASQVATMGRGSRSGQK